MSLLQQCTILWGSNNIISNDPEIKVEKNSLYLPQSYGSVCGIYSERGGIVRLATDTREGNKPCHNQSWEDIERENFSQSEVVDETLIYGGFINVHYGHFLINSLPRLWAIKKLKTPSMRILCHAGTQPQEWLRYPYIATLMGALGLRSTDFVTPTQATIVKDLIVSGTSLHEQFSGHQIYSSFCLEIAERLLHRQPIEKRGQFAYFSKSQLKTAVGLIENEAVIDETLRGYGVDVLFPEQLTLADQIAVYRNYDCIMGSSGSFLHTSVFSKHSKIVCLNVTEQINSNYSIIDSLANNDAKYYYPPAMQVNQNRPGVLTSRTLPDADTVARELLRQTV